jgi:hypothetical protein
MNTKMTSQRMKRLALVAAIGAATLGDLTLAPSVLAQDQSNGSQSAERINPTRMTERRVATLTSHLQLTSGQITQVRAIITQEHEQLLALRDNASNSLKGNAIDLSRIERTGPGPRVARNALPPEVRAVRERTEREIERVLTPQQLTAYRALKEGRTLQLKRVGVDS